MSLKNFILSNLDPFLGGKGDPAFLSPPPCCCVGDREVQVYCLCNNYPTIDVSHWYDAEDEDLGNCKELWFFMLPPFNMTPTAAPIRSAMYFALPSSTAGGADFWTKFTDHSAEIVAQPYRIGLISFMEQYPTFDAFGNLSFDPGEGYRMYNMANFLHLKRAHVLSQGFRIRPFFTGSDCSCYCNTFCVNLGSSESILPYGTTLGDHYCATNEAAVTSAMETIYSSLSTQSYSSGLSAPDFVLRRPLSDKFHEGYSVNASFVNDPAYTTAVGRPLVDHVLPLVGARFTFPEGVDRIHIDSVCTLQYQSPDVCLHSYRAPGRPIVQGSSLFSLLSLGPICLLQ